MSKNNFQGLCLQCLYHRRPPINLNFGHMLIAQRHNVQAIGCTQRMPGKKLAQALLQPPPRFSIHIGCRKHRFLHPKAPVSFEQYRTHQPGGKQPLVARPKPNAKLSIAHREVRTKRIEVNLHPYRAAGKQTSSRRSRSGGNFQAESTSAGQGELLSCDPVTRRRTPCTSGDNPGNMPAPYRAWQCLFLPAERPARLLCCPLESRFSPQ